MLNNIGSRCDVIREDKWEFTFSARDVVCTGLGDFSASIHRAVCTESNMEDKSPTAGKMAGQTLKMEAESFFFVFETLVNCFQTEKCYIPQNIKIISVLWTESETFPSPKLPHLSRCRSWTVLRLIEEAFKLPCLWVQICSSTNNYYWIQYGQWVLRWQVNKYFAKQNRRNINEICARRGWVNWFWVPKAIKPALHFVLCCTSFILLNRIDIISITNFNPFNWSV